MDQNLSDVLLALVDNERNVYEPARLYHQARRSVTDYISLLQSVDGAASALDYEPGALVSTCSDARYPVRDDIVNFLPSGAALGSELYLLNQSFLRYHRSLSPYTLLNDTPRISLVAEVSGIGQLQNLRVIDVGGGTGHTLCTFFQYPETLEYYLVDPNIRLLHDQFIRIYPRLLELKMAHILAYAEHLPFKDGCADVVMSYSSIDHFGDYRAFITEAARILKPHGRLLVSSHLEDSASRAAGVRMRRLGDKLWSPTLPERFARYVYYRRYRVGRDDHTVHFADVSPIADALVAAGLRIVVNETIKRQFCIVAIKP